MSNRRLDTALIALQISNLLLANPELVDDEVLRTDMVEGSTEAFELLRELEAKRREACTLAGGIAGTIAELQARLGRFERREQALRSLAFRIMTAADLRKVELPEATLSIVNGQPRVLITDETIIPDVLCRIKREPDKTRIKEMLKDGKEVRGAVLSNSEPHISIRTK
jgi:hypothetical protein